MKNFPPILIKTKDLFNDTIYPILKNFPKSERYALSQSIKNAFTNFMSSLNSAQTIKYKRIHYLTKADSYHSDILILVSTAYRQKYITQKKLMQIQEELYEIGKMLGGWMKKQN